MVRVLRAIEDARSDQDAALREPLHGGPGVLTARKPQVQAGLAPIDPESRFLHGGKQDPAPVPVQLPLLGDEYNAWVLFSDG